MQRSGSLDLTAMSLSGLCVVHCLALPLMASALPLLGVWAEAEWVHWTFVALAAPVSVLAFARRPRNWTTLALALIAALGIAALVAGALGWPTETSEGAITVTGSLLLATAHLLNWRLGQTRCRAVSP